MRMVALLFSLAALADCVACLPLPVRVAVMFFLRPAESVAREFVTGVAASSGPMPAWSGDGRRDAVLLGDSFRALGMALAAFAASLSCGCRGRHDSRSMAAERGVGQMLSGCLFPVSKPFDTS